YGLDAGVSGDAVAFDKSLGDATLFRRSGDGFIGTGPFRIVEQNDEHLLLKRARHVDHQIDEVELISFPSPRAQFAPLLRCAVGLLVSPDYGEEELLRGVPRLKLVRGSGIVGFAVVFNTARLSPP